ncbi:MAG: alternate-type signal peptide domain-containing protein [Propionibacterium sp.]|nr:alternate-type signal peptide domain-containing protein [Propionibacterium sp.]
MNKMFKGAALTGLGVALLLGGGGTLAVWNAAAETDAGQIVAGDLNLEADAGVWTSDLAGGAIDIEDYLVVPGETLTFTQPLSITLEGNQLAADFTVTGTSAANGFASGTVDVTTTLNGQPVGDGLRLTESAKASSAVTTFAFDADGRESVNAEYDFSKVGYALDQVVPGTN